MKPLLQLLFLFVSLTALSQETELLTWPRVIEKGDHTINLYQPQLETLEGNILKGRMAISVKDGEDNLVFGAMWFAVRLATDLESRTAVLESMNISKIKFPDFEDQSKLKRLEGIIIDDLASVELVMSLDRIISSLETVGTETSLEDQLNNSAPEIYFRKVPTVLVVIDGEPQLETVENSKMEYVINTPFFIVKFKNTYYLKGANHWYQSTKIVTDQWVETKKVPKDVMKLAEQQFEEADQDSAASDDDAPPEIIVVTEASELVVSEGELAYEPITGTSLLYVTNTESDIVLDITTQQHYLLLNGRWYSTRTMKDMEWQFIEPDSLPKEFASIPEDHESISGMRASVPGTPESQEAVYEQYIPQTAVVDRKTASTEVTYDGEPKFELIEGTSIASAVNTESTVLYVDDKYYVVDDGIWFEGPAPTGPWIVADTRPEEIENIPPSSPVYNVKYVYVYDSTPDVVYVGYTPGYYHSYVYGGVVVYGTGFYYRPWYGYYYYPRPVTFGFGVHYNPYTGWGFSVGVSYGWLTLSFHNHHSYWGPGGYAHGYRHGYRHGYHHGYHDGYRAGYARGRYDSRNAYRNSREGRARTGVTTRRETRTAQRSNRTQPERPRRAEGKRNDLYADRSGNVHQRDRNGNWEQKRNNRSEQREPRTRESRPKQNPQTQQRQRQQLERDYNSRNRGNSNHRSYNQNRARPQRRGGAVRGRRG